MTIANHRQSDHDIDPLFLNRWSPRAFADVLMPESELLTLLEAARWSPSSGNSQPWRFVYALRGGDSWNTFVELLVEFNQSWAKNAAALVFVVAKTHHISAGSTEEKPTRTASFDTGAAWAMMAIQAELKGYITHGMGGVHFDKAAQVLGVPEHGYKIEAAIAIGKIGDPAQLSDALREREKPSSRMALSDIVFQGQFIAK